MRWIRVSFIVFCMSVFVWNAHAVVRDVQLDRHWVKKAQAIVLGTVVEVNYKSSEPTEQQPTPIPHTFVTIQVENIFKGQIELTNDSLTLRFQGGPGEDGRLMVVRGAPLFDAGDRGVFFIEDNSSDIVPLIGWRQGFIRILEGGELILTDLGNDFLLSNDPLLAAQIHPRDILDYTQLASLLISQQRPIDQTLWNNLSPVTRQLIENPGSLANMDPRALTFEMTTKTAAVIQEHPAMQERDPQEIYREILPVRYRAQAHNIAQAMMLRDLNQILMNAFVFGENQFAGIELSERTSALAFVNPAELPYEQALLRNRRILEDAYPNLFLKSLDRTMARGSYIAHPEIMTNTIGDNEFEMFMPQEPEEGEGPQPGAEPVPKGEPVTQSVLFEHLAEMVEVLHTDAELEVLPTVQSARIEEPNALRYSHA